MSRPWGSLRIRNYRLWFIGSLVSNIGSWMQRTAQDWLVLTELTHHDAGMLGVLVSLQFAPFLLLTPVAGWLVDRYSRRTILIYTQSISLLLALGLGLLVISGLARLWHVMLFALVLGIVGALDAPARQAFVSDLVSRKFLVNAVSLNSAAFNLARLVGPASAGALIALLGTGPAFLVNAVSFLASVGALLLMRLEFMQRQIRHRGSLWGGISYARTRPDILLIFVMIFLVSSFGYNFAMFSATFTSVVFGLGAESFGLFSALIALGSVGGAMINARSRKPRLGVIVAATASLATWIIVASWAPGMWIFAVIMPLVGISAMFINTTANSYIQLTCDERVRGRVIALYLAIFVGATPFGAPLVGLMINLWGVRLSMTIAGIMCLLAFGIALIWNAYYKRMDYSVLTWKLWRYRSLSPSDSTDSIKIVEIENDRR